ncbi:fimbrial protein [Lelliottia sp. WAP21]|uniref:fimbrial protein n=1 Tax=Lelliottia sp. WAP21 TaxID=2877426 RepID=UPI001E36C2F2|nr:fimbrial protein [Lelliottia sp. WAP21]
MQKLLLFFFLIFSNNVFANIDFSGNLSDRPCIIDPAHQDQNVVFERIADLTFNNWPGKSYTERFSIKLKHCDVTTFRKVLRLTFLGSEETALPGHLKVAGNNAGKLGIGIVDTDGSSLLELGNSHNSGMGSKVVGLGLTLNFGAFIQSTPEAIANKSVQPGDYNAIATFELDYQ